METVWNVGWGCGQVQRMDEEWWLIRYGVEAQQLLDKPWQIWDGLSASSLRLCDDVSMNI